MQDGVPCHKSKFLKDIYGDHQVGSGGNGDHIRCHTSIQVVMFAAAQLAALTPSREASGMVPGSSPELELWLSCCT